MNQLDRVLANVGKSRWRNYMVNVGLWRMIPFNQPHRIRVQSAGNGRASIRLPYIRKNLNHIKGLHACALATLAEYCSGLAILTTLDPKQYRIIMQKLQMDYHYQGKSDAIVTYDIASDIEFESKKIQLEGGEPVVFECNPKIFDSKQNLIAEGHVFWHVKAWDQVKTKV